MMGKTILSLKPLFFNWLEYLRVLKGYPSGAALRRIYPPFPGLELALFHSYWWSARPVVTTSPLAIVWTAHITGLAQHDLDRQAESN